jgi:hypothetical protein
MNEIKKNFQIVVARYNERLDWLIPFKQITIIYNKGNNDDILNKFDCITLPNFGRESHTYLYHIITNYDNLAEKTLFFQGRIDDHKVFSLEEYFREEEFIGKLEILPMNTFKKKIQHFDKWKVEYENGSMKPSIYTPFQWLKYIAGVNFDESNNIKIVWGANFALDKNLILKKPKIFYENLLRLLDFHSNPEEGHFFERSWYTIFTNDYTPKPKIGFYKLKNIDEINNINQNINYILKKNDIEELHLWIPITANLNIPKEYKIYYTPNNNKYNTIYPNINNNSFKLNIKGKNDIHILIELENEYFYEIVLGGWEGKKSVIRDDIQGNEISIHHENILDRFNFISFEFILNQIITVKKNGINIMEVNNNYKNYSIKYIKIKSAFGSDALWEYDNNSCINNNLKLFLLNNNYQNMSLYYTYNYLNNYVLEADIYNLE